MDLGKRVTAQCGKMQTVTTLCQFRCGVVEVWAVKPVPNEVALLIFRGVLYDNLVGATSSEGMLVT